MQARYELFDHTADVGVRVARDWPALEPATRGLYEVIGELAGKTGAQAGAAGSAVMSRRNAAGLSGRVLRQIETCHQIATSRSRAVY